MRYNLIMRVITGSDHGGFAMKEKIAVWLKERGFEVLDVGATTFDEDDDFVDYARMAVAKMDSEDDRVILFCRNGFGMCVAANRFAKIRCGIAFDDEAVRRGRVDDDINCLSLAADYIDEETAKRRIDIFLKERFSGEEKYQRRVRKLQFLQ